MAVWYVNATVGDDTNSGTSTALPFATIAKVATVAGSGDTIYFNGIFRINAQVTFNQLSNVNYLAEPGATTAQIRWERLAGTGWTSLGGNRWSKTLPTGLGSGGGSSAVLGEFLFQWNTTTDSSGRPTGHLQYIAGSGTANSYDYNNATGATTINVSGSPNGATTDVSYSVGNNCVAIFIEGGSGNRIDGLTFALHCATGTSYGIQVHANHDTTIVNCTFYDAQWHHAGFLNHTVDGIAGVNNVFDSCVFFGGAGGLGLSVHYAQTSSVAANGARWIDCIFHSHRYLDPTGTTMSGQVANTQYGALAHGDSSGAIADIMLDGCTWIEYESGGTLCSLGNLPAAPAPSWTWGDYAARLDRCVLMGGGSQTGISIFRPGNPMGIRRTIFDARNAGPSGLCGVGGSGWFDTNSYPVVFEASAFVFDPNDPVNQTAMFYAFHSGDDIRLSNCSIHCINGAANTNQRTLFCYLFNNLNTIRLRGCAISWDATNTRNRLCAQDGAADATHHDFIDNAYLNVGQYSDNASFDTQAEWLAAVDTSAIFPTTAMFPNAPTNLKLTSASSIRNSVRKTYAIRPEQGINDDYFGLYGAYQYPASVELDVPSVAESMMRDACAILRMTPGQSATSAEATTSWTVVAYAVKCSVQSIKTGESEMLQRSYPYYSFDVYFPPNIDIQSLDRIIFITGPAGLADRTLEVRSFPIDDAGLQAYLRVQCEEVKGNP